MITVGCVVRSVAGHDGDSFYVVLKTEGGRVFIADGKARTLAKPKAKSPRHVRRTSTILKPEEYATDKKLREALKPFNDATGK